MRRLEILLTLAIALLILQMIWLPAGEIRAVDPRAWSRGVWIGLNIVLLACFCGIRFRRHLSCLRTVLSRNGAPMSKTSSGVPVEHDLDYNARHRRDAEWRERAGKRLPFT